MTVLFTLPRQVMPYREWQRTAFALLPQAGRLSAVLEAAIMAEGWREREGATLAAAR